VDRSVRKTLLLTIKTVLKNHPTKAVRIDCVQQILNLYDDPSPEEIDIVVGAFRDCPMSPEKVEAELIPFATQMMTSPVPAQLCLLTRIVATFAGRCSVQLRSTHLLSIMRQLSEHGNSEVRAAAARDCAALVDAFGDIPDAAQKLVDLVDLGKHFVFDPQGAVQSAGLTVFIPAMVNFAKLQQCLGSVCFEYWLKLYLSSGLTGSSQLAVVRFKLASQVLEIIAVNLLPATPRDDQAISDEGSGNVVVVPKTEFTWIKSRLPEILPKFSALLYVQLPIKREATRLAAKCCQALGKKFFVSDIVPVFNKLIEGSANQDTPQHAAFFLCAIACVDQELFLAKARDYINYSANEKFGFKNPDVQSHIASALAIFCGREPASHEMVLKLVDDLSKVTRAAIKSSSIIIITEIASVLEQRELEIEIMPIVSRLAVDLDEALQLETVTCVGKILRFTTSVNVMKTVRDLFDEWFKGRPTVKLQVLRTMVSNVSDIEAQFRDTYIVPKLAECVRPDFPWGELADQAVVLVVTFLASLKDQFSEGSIRSQVVQIVDALSAKTALEGDPMLKDLRETFRGEKGTRFGSFF
jgi:hypothetical protein